MRALTSAYAGRKQRKRQMRQLWIARINAAARMIRIRWNNGHCNALEREKAFLLQSKINCMPAEGYMSFDGVTYWFSPEKDYGTLDWGRGSGLTTIPGTGVPETGRSAEDLSIQYRVRVRGYIGGDGKYPFL